MKTKTYSVEVSHVQYSVGHVTVKAKTKAEASEKAHKLWDDGEIETDPIDGEFNVNNITEKK